MFDAETVRFLNAFFELFVVVSFGIGWLILELMGRRLDRQKEERERASRKHADEASERAAGHLERQHHLDNS